MLYLKSSLKGGPNVKLHRYASTHGSFSAIFQFTLQPPQNNPGTQSQAAPGHSDTRHQRNWNRVWQLALAVMGSMLRTLRHGFLKEALDFAGVHRERLAEVCKDSIALMMAILGDRGAASRHEIFTKEITASIDHTKYGRASGKLTLTEIVPEAFGFPCF